MVTWASDNFLLDFIVFLCNPAYESKCTRNETIKTHCKPTGKTAFLRVLTGSRATQPLLPWVVYLEQLLDAFCLLCGPEQHLIRHPICSLLDCGYPVSVEDTRFVQKGCTVQIVIYAPGRETLQEEEEITDVISHHLIWDWAFSFQQFW